MPAVDRQLLRIGAYELVAEATVPVAVIIDEAVELAKQYSTADSGRFVNGVLAAIAHRGSPRRGTARMSDAYQAAGVDYGVLDAAKRRALARRSRRRSTPLGRGAAVDDSSRGEPATVVTVGDQTARVRPRVPRDEVDDRPGLRRVERASIAFDAIGYDTVAAVVNDCCCVGALPFLVNAYVATGSAAFYQGSRHASLVEGFAAAVPTPARRGAEASHRPFLDLSIPTEIDLARRARHRADSPPRPAPRLRALRPGDEIVLFASSGLHANGASARPSGHERPRRGSRGRPLRSGRLFGDLVARSERDLRTARRGTACQQAGSQSTTSATSPGTALRKLMRADRQLHLLHRGSSRMSPRRSSFLVDAALTLPMRARPTGRSTWVRDSASSALSPQGSGQAGRRPRRRAWLSRRLSLVMSSPVSAVS